MNATVESKEAGKQGIDWHDLPRVYQALARLLEYPQNKESLLHCLATVTTHIEDDGAVPGIETFREFLDRSTLPELQEEFVATFDFNPAKAPYLGHHLYGDNQKKAAYMIMLKEAFARFGFHPQRNELPDHLSVVLAFLADLGLKKEEEYRHQFIAKMVLPGVQKLTASQSERNQSPWFPLIEAAELLLSDDCKEVSP